MIVDAYRAAYSNPSGNLIKTPNFVDAQQPKDRDEGRLPTADAGFRVYMGLHGAMADGRTHGLGFSVYGAGLRILDLAEGLRH